MESYIQRIWNLKLGRVTVAVREGENSHDCSNFRRRMLYCGVIVTGDLQRTFLFAENGWSDQSWNNWTMPVKWITTGWARGNMCVDSWVHIELTLSEQFSICASSGKNNYFLSDADLECICISCWRLQFHFHENFSNIHQFSTGNDNELHVVHNITW